MKWYPLWQHKDSIGPSWKLWASKAILIETGRNGKFKKNNCLIWNWKEKTVTQETLHGWSLAW